jgi:hypothetical protein
MPPHLIAVVAGRERVAMLDACHSMLALPIWCPFRAC